ncbi:MAG: peroxiredoxin [Pseudomonadota bacterium]
MANQPFNGSDTPDWSALAVPQDDGATDHLSGIALACVPLKGTDGASYDLSALPGTTVLYIYPKTGQPGKDMPEGWDMIPGARGCTPQSCSFRDHFAELKGLGVDHLFGLSTQAGAYQTEAAERLHLPFPVLSDADLAFATALRLPTFEAWGETLIKRMAFVIKDGVIVHVFYPVFPPDQNAAMVVDWLKAA